MNREQVIADGDFALIGIAHENGFGDFSFKHVLQSLRPLFVQWNIFRPDRDHRSLILLQIGRWNKAQNPFFGFQLSRLAVAIDLDDLAFDEIGQTQEGRGKSAFRPGVKLMRRADFDQHATVHHGDLVGNRQRFGLIVSHKNRRNVRSPLQRLDLGTHLNTELRIKIAQRLVEQHDLRLVDERSRKRDALLLAAGKFRRRTILQSIEADNFQNVADPALNFILGPSVDG